MKEKAALSMWKVASWRLCWGLYSWQWWKWALLPILCWFVIIIIVLLIVHVYNFRCDSYNFCPIVNLNPSLNLIPIPHSYATLHSTLPRLWSYRLLRTDTIYRLHIHFLLTYRPPAVFNVLLGPYNLRQLYTLNTHC